MEKKSPSSREAWTSSARVQCFCAINTDMLLKSIAYITAQFFHWTVLLILTNDNVMHLPLQHHIEKFY